MANPMILERFRKSKSDWTQEEFAKKLGMSKSTYQRVINEESPLTIEVLQHAAKLLKVDPEEMIQQSVVEEPGTMYTSPPSIKLSVNIELDGTAATLDHWVGILKKVNASLT